MRAEMLFDIWLFFFISLTELPYLMLNLSITLTVLQEHLCAAKSLAAVENNIVLDCKLQTRIGEQPLKQPVPAINQLLIGRINSYKV